MWREASGTPSCRASAVRNRGVPARTRSQGRRPPGPPPSGGTRPGPTHARRFLGHRGRLCTCRTGWLGSCGRGHLHRCGDRVSAEPVCPGHGKECAELQGRAAGCHLPRACVTHSPAHTRVPSSDHVSGSARGPHVDEGDGDRATGRRKMTRPNTCRGGGGRGDEHSAACGAWDECLPPAADGRRRRLRSRSDPVTSGAGTRPGAPTQALPRAAGAASRGSRPTLGV